MLTQYNLVTNNYNIEYRELNGIDHIVLPVIMMVEGVHNGSSGPLFHPATELGRNPSLWNGMPVVVNHPMVNGNPVSANSPDILNEYQIGQIFDAYFEDNKLKGYVWINLEKAQSKFPEVLEYIENKKPLDVSVGVFNEVDEVQGIWNNEEYVGIATNHIPDHLALLPGGTGACSWNDGCGIRINQEGKMTKEKENKGVNTYLNTLSNEYKELGYKLQEVLNQKDKTGEYYYLDALYDSYIVYRVEKPEGSYYYKEDYEVNNDGNVTLKGNPIQVKREVSYPSVNNEQNTQGGKMSKEFKPCCPEKVEKIISINSTFTKEDKEWMEKLSEEQLNKIQALAESKVEVKEVEVEKEVTKEDALNALSEHLSDPEKFMDLLPKEIQEQLKHGLKLHNDQKMEFIKKITANSEAWTEDELKAKSFDELQKMASLIKEPVDYSVMGVGNVPTNNEENTDEDLLLPVGVQINKEDK